MSASTSAENATAGERPAWPPLPTETEIYILPDGTVVFADLPAELASLATDLGNARPGEIDDPVNKPGFSQKPGLSMTPIGEL